MVIEALNELITLSDELATLRDKPLAVPQTVPEFPTLHAELATVLASGIFAFRRAGVDATKVGEFTERARSNGLRRKVLIFGWHPRGHTWLATPLNFGPEPEILVLDRLNRLSATELTLPGFIQRCIEQTSEAITEEKAPKEVVPEPGQLRDLAAAEALLPPKPERQARVDLIDSGGATTIADGQTDELTGPELAYILWCLEKLGLISEDPTPDLSRWVRRCLRTTRLDEVPEEGGPNHALYLEHWDRLTLGDRSARGSETHQIPAWKFASHGFWVLAPAELAILRRAEKSRPHHHRPDEAQAATWARWSAIVLADHVELHVHECGA